MSGHGQKPKSMQQKSAVILLSGGLDSATVLAIAREQGFRCYTLAVDYGQRHRAELQAAERLSKAMGSVEHRQMRIDLAGIGGSALTDPSIDVPEQGGSGIPVTYVPARNTLLLSLALGWAEAIGSHDLFIGVNAVDYSGYPDCRPEFIEAFAGLAKLATREGVEGRPIRVHAPLLHMSKQQIILRGTALGVDYGQTVSCYQLDPNLAACGRCDSCRIRQAGFQAAGVVDPTRYA